MKKFLTGLGIVLMSYFPIKGFSQPNCLKKKKAFDIEVRGEVARNALNSKSNNLFSKLYVSGNLKTKRFFSDVEGHVDEYSLNGFLKVGSGMNFFKTERFSFSPEISFTKEICYAKDNEENSAYHNILENKLGPGLKFEYGIGRFRGDNEIIFPVGEFDKPRYYLRNSCRLGKGEIELFLRGRGLDENYLGTKYTTKQIWKDFRLFAEYAVKNNPATLKNDFMNLGIALKGE